MKVETISKTQARESEEVLKGRGSDAPVIGFASEESGLMSKGLPAQLIRIQSVLWRSLLLCLALLFAAGGTASAAGEAEGLKRAEVAYKRQDWQAARTAVDQALKQDASLHELWVLKGLLAAADGDVKAAAAAFARVQKLAPKNIQAQAGAYVKSVELFRARAKGAKDGRLDVATLSACWQHCVNFLGWVVSRYGNARAASTSTGYWGVTTAI